AIVNDFDGRKIVCGATTADIISRELNRNIEDSFDFDDPDLPPISMMDGIDLVTEGILTLGKVTEILKTYNSSTRLTKGPADRIVRMLIESDEIHFIIGTRINIAHQDPSLPVELEIRRTVVKRIARLLEDKFLKEVRVTFI
ncbi:MAG: stage II sporulation protein E, partial [Lentimicrobium sp.]|nr:stage II sporulation protein E [Lentimicrobium sp.]